MKNIKELVSLLTEKADKLDWEISDDACEGISIKRNPASFSLNTPNGLRDVELTIFGHIRLFKTHYHNMPPENKIFLQIDGETIAEAEGKPLYEIYNRIRPNLKSHSKDRLIEHAISHLKES